MNNSENYIRANDLKFTHDYMIVTLEDGRILQMPLDWFPPLRTATRAQLHHYEWIGKGIGIEWPDLDEFLSVEGFLRQTRSMAVQHPTPERAKRLRRNPTDATIKPRTSARRTVPRKAAA
ncbi:MAG TPA: DUF2442 domain-containing protein [Candidatus Kapabacteria bacterium]|nr:DUF2442 domain-containing protein [Candidatus Kapabacteria bacterium]